MSDAGQEYIVAAQKAAELAQTKYKSMTKVQQFIKFMKGN